MTASGDEPGSAALALAILQRLPRLQSSPLERRRMVVGVAGESGSGKTHTAIALARALGEGRAALLHQDDYFHLPPRANHARRCGDLGQVGAHEVDLGLLGRHIAAFRAGARNVTVPVVDPPSDSILTRRMDFSAVDRLIVEGTYVLQLDDLDVGIFLTATHHDTEERRRRRDRDPILPVTERILAIEHAIIAQQASRADLLVDGDFRIIASAP